MKTHSNARSARPEIRLASIDAARLSVETPVGRRRPKTSKKTTATSSASQITVAFTSRISNVNELTESNQRNRSHEQPRQTQEAPLPTGCEKVIYCRAQCGDAGRMTAEQQSNEFEEHGRA